MFKEIVGFKYIESEMQNKVLGNQGYFRFTNEELKEMNPVGYNFIMNLKNENNEYIEYEKVGDKK